MGFGPALRARAEDRKSRQGDAAVSPRKNNLQLTPAARHRMEDTEAQATAGSPCQHQNGGVGAAQARRWW